MTETVPEPSPPRTAEPPVDPVLGLARRNVRLGLMLLGLSVLLFVGTFAVALVYLQLD